MDAIQRKLTQLLDSSDLELRTAAVHVISEVGISSKNVTQALARCLREPHENLRLAALKGLARLGAEDVAHVVVPLLLSAGPLREQAMAVIAAVGQSVIPQLTTLYPQADFHGKRAVITALARIGMRPALAFLLKILPQEPFEIQKHLTLNICEALDRMSPAAQLPIFSLVLRMLRGKAALKSPQILITGAILLGHFRGTRLAGRSRRELRLLAERKHPPEVRRHALVSFNRSLSELKLTNQEEHFLYKMLCDEDWHNVAQHALTGFQRLEVPKQRLSKLVELLHNSPHFSVHIHIFERLQTIDRHEVAEAIIPFLSDARFRVREAAEAALRKMPSAIESLFAVLMKADDLEVTQRINSILCDFPQETRKKYLDRACTRLMSLFDQNDPHYRSFLDFVRSVDPEPVRKRIYEKARALKAGRAKDKWERIAAYLQLLWDNHLITAEGRYWLGVAHLRLSSKDLAPASRRANLGLQVLRSLIYDDHAALAKKLMADKDLTPDDYFYLGFHFCEAGEEMRPFAMTMLEHVMKKHPKSKAAGPATHKMQLQVKMLEAKKEEEAKAKQGAGESRAAKASAKAAAAAALAAAQGKSSPEERKPQAAPGAKPPVASGERAAEAKVSPRAAPKAPKAPKAKEAQAAKKPASKPRAAVTVSARAVPTRKGPARKRPAKKASTPKTSAGKKSGKQKPAAKKPAAGKKRRPPGPIRIKRNGSAAAAKKAVKKAGKGAKARPKKR